MPENLLPGLIAACREMATAERLGSLTHVHCRAYGGARVQKRGRDGRQGREVDGLSIRIPASPARHAAESLGLDAAFFVPAGAHPPGDRLPKAPPPDWVKLGDSLEPTAEKDWFQVAIARGKEPGGPGTLVFRPNTATGLLLRRLEQMREKPENWAIPTAERVFGWSESAAVPAVPAGGRGNPAQRAAIGHALANQVSLIWGPPGTGKSQTISALLAEFMGSGMSVWLGSTTNRAVDSVALRLAAMARSGHRAIASAIASERITRYGSGAVPEIGEIAHVARGDPDLPPPDAEACMQVDMVSMSTLTRLVAGAGRLYDAVVIDEVGTVSLPWVYAAAACARRAVVLVGDRRQFRPIVTPRRLGAACRESFSSTIFDHLGVRYDGTDRRMVLLDTQYRMRDAIAETVRLTGLYPSYRTPPGDKPLGEAGEAAMALPPLPGREVAVIDTSALPRRYHDRENPAHVEIGLRLARSYGSRPPLAPVMIICPYVNQVRAYRHALGEDHGRIARVGTVHSFQGDESPVVIFDSVEGPPESGAAPRAAFTNEFAAPSLEALNLLNVAVSRAQYKLLLLLHADLIEGSFPPRAFLRRLLGRCRRDGLVVRAAPADGGAGAPDAGESLPADGVIAAIGRDLADASTVELRAAAPSDPRVATAAVRWLAGGRRRVLLYGPERPLGSLGASAAHPGSRWPHGRWDMALDGHVFYRGVAGLLDRLVNERVIRHAAAAPPAPAGGP